MGVATGNGQRVRLFVDTVNALNRLMSAEQARDAAEVRYRKAAGGPVLELTRALGRLRKATDRVQEARATAGALASAVTEEIKRRMFVDRQVMPRELEG